MKDDCCLACRRVRLRDASFIEQMTAGMLVCPTCGNKRCPHATDHQLTCTGSNEPGQPGSAYPAPMKDVPTCFQCGGVPGGAERWRYLRSADGSTEVSVHRDCFRSFAAFVKDQYNQMPVPS